jgi:hypothetical protein
MLVQIPFVQENLLFDHISALHQIAQTNPVLLLDRLRHIKPKLHLFL